MRNKIALPLTTFNAIIFISIWIIDPFIIHTYGIFNVVYNGELVQNNLVSIYYFKGIDLNHKVEEYILKPNIYHAYTVRRGRYGFQGFIIKIDPALFNNDQAKPLEISYNYFNNASTKRTLSTLIEIESTEESLEYKGTLTVLSKHDNELFYKTNFEFKISDDNIINFKNINRGP